MARFGVERRGEARQARLGLARPGVARRGAVGHGRRGVVVLGVAWSYGDTNGKAGKEK